MFNLDFSGSMAGKSWTSVLKSTKGDSIIYHSFF